MFIYSVLFILFLIVFAFVCFGFNEQFRHDALSILGGWSLFFAVAWFLLHLVGLPISYGGQVNDVESIQQEKENIVIQQDRLKRLTTLLDKFNYPDVNVLANSDTPVGSVVEQISDVERDIAQRKERITYHKREIRWRSNWIFYYVVDWHPLEE